MKPNFLLLLADQHRGDYLPYSSEIHKQLGNENLNLTMPNTAALMNNGVTFINCYSPSPLCAPARACLASGMRYDSCRVAGNFINYDSSLRTFYSDLNEAGYQVGGVGKFDLNKADFDWGENGFGEHLKKMGFTHAIDNEGKMDAVLAELSNSGGPYMDYLRSKNLADTHKMDMLLRRKQTHPTPLDEEDYCDNWITRNCIKTIDEFEKDKPWFMQVNFVCPHDPYDVTHTMHENYLNRDFPKAIRHTLDDNNDKIRQNYAAMLENIDNCCANIINHLKETNQFENTIIIYSADHGEMLGDFDKYGKTTSEQASVRIPFIIDASRFGGGQNIVSTAPIELQDIGATLLDYIGKQPLSKNDSISIKPIVDGKIEKTRNYAISTVSKFPTDVSSKISKLPLPGVDKIAKKMIDAKIAAGIWDTRTTGAITDGTFKLILESYKEPKLFNLLNDPHELDDISKNHPDIVQSLTEKYILKVV